MNWMHTQWFCSVLDQCCNIVAQSEAETELSSSAFHLLGYWCSTFDSYVLGSHVEINLSGYLLCMYTYSKKYTLECLRNLHFVRFPTPLQSPKSSLVTLRAETRYAGIEELRAMKTEDEENDVTFIWAKKCHYKHYSQRPLACMLASFCMRLHDKNHITLHTSRWQ